MVDDPYALAARAADWLRAHGPAPRVCAVLGSGLGALAERLTDPVAFSYADIPGFADVSVTGHAGQLVVGGLGDGGPRIAALAGRVHLYEGHPTARVVHAIRTMRLWGVQAALITNAAGGVNPAYRPGDLMVISDHLNLTGQNPLTGPHDARFGARFPDMSAAYDPALRAILQATAREQGNPLHEGVYAGLLGPSYETPAEIRMLGRVGADAVGMSTVHEVIAGHHCGLRVVGVSCITNLAAGLGNAHLDHDEVKDVATQARPRFLALLEQGLARIDAALAVR
ncbi:MAG: purine-nucleoside phosphorylase [bacterium]